MTEWHARRALQKTPPRDPVPEKVSEAAAEFAALVWQVAADIAEGRLQAERTSIEEARQQWDAEKAETAAFADQLNQELEAAKAKCGELTVAIEVAAARIASLQSERDQELVRADSLQAVTDERQKIVDALQEELVQVRRDKEGEIARLVAAMRRSAL